MERLLPSAGRLLIGAYVGVCAYWMLRFGHAAVDWHPWLFFVPEEALLFIHETGHLLFLPFQLAWHSAGFGMFLYILGGSLLQWAAPLAIAVYFAISRQWFSAGVMVCWWGESLLMSVPYIADAQSMEMPLVGGATIHDWHYMLGQLGKLDSADALASFFLHASQCVLVAGILAMCVSFFLGFWTDAPDPGEE